MAAALAWCKRNNVKLDTATTFRDLGKSAYLGTHRKNPDRNALASFLKLVETGRIPRGSYLIIENLDRLSREDIRPALSLLLSLIDAGIRIVQLKPSELIYDEDVEPPTLMMAIMELSRGHSESAMKSERVGKAWAQKKERAATEKRPITRTCPGWLRVAGETPADYHYVLIDERVAVVKRIFRMAGEGYGTGAIVRILNSEGVPAFGRSGHWTRPSVGDYLRGREVLGEYQRGRRRGNVRTDDGPPVVDFYPPIITEAEWEAANAGRLWRRSRIGSAGGAGRPGPRVDVFRGLLHDATGGGRVHVKYRRGNGDAVLIPYRARLGCQGTRSTSFPLVVFERAVLDWLREIDPRAILPKGDDAADRVLALTGKLAGIDGRIAAVQEQLAGDDGDVRSLAEVLKTLDGRRVAAAAELAEARRKAATPAVQAWAEFGSIVDVLDQALDPNDARTRLRSVLRQMLTATWCIFASRGKYRLAACQVWFEADGCRNYLIVHQQAFATQKRGQTVLTPAQTNAVDFAEAFPAAGSLDFRKPKDAAKVVQWLESVSLDDLG
jgi:DNA invertase Pin-like site-specific DNA recombinase